MKIKVSKIDLITKEVEESPVMSTPRLNPTVAIIGKYVSVAGGNLDERKLASVERFVTTTTKKLEIDVLLTQYSQI